MASEEQKHRVRSLRMYATRRALVLLVPLAAVVVLLVNREESEPPVTLTPRPRETERVLVRSDAQPVPPQQTPSSTPARQPTTAPTSFMPESTTAVPTMTGAPATAAATATPHTPQPGGIPREPLLNQSRVAICLAGGVRSLRLVAPSIRLNLIEALRGGLGHFVHVFLEISTEQDCFANYNNVATTAECVEYARRAAAWAHKPSNITRAFRGASVTVNIVNQFNCSHPFVQSHVCCVRENGRAMNDKGEGFVWGMAQYMRRRLCYDRIKQHEAEIGKAFDLVVITRPDMLFLEPLPPAQWFLSSLPRIYAMSKDDGWGDYLFIAPRSLSDDLDRVFDQCFTTPCSEANPNRGLPPEARLGPALEHGHPHHRFPFQAVIRRSEIRADCWRLANGINDVGRYLSPSSGNLAYRHDVCKEQYPLRIPPP